MMIPYNECEYRSTESGYVLVARPHSDMVVDAQSGSVVSNAVYLAQEITGNFTISARVSHDFASTYDACCLIAYANDQLWSKACFECTEEGEHAVVTVMTNGRSDDANSVRIEDKQVYLQMCRRGDVVSVQYSIDGEHWTFVRILSIPLPATVRLGLLAQSPVGMGGDFCFDDVKIAPHAPDNMRFGK